MSDLQAIRAIIDAELRDAQMGNWIPEENISSLLLILDMNFLLTERPIDDPEAWRSRVRDARQNALEQIVGKWDK